MLEKATAFPATADTLRLPLREAILDHHAFETMLRPCELASCRATCCHDGAVLSAEEARTIDELLNTHRDAFSGALLPAAAPAIVPQNRSFKTATRPARHGECAEEFPTHFPRTRCVFLKADHKCSLQLLSVSQGHHPWFFKPISCWMHPILLRPGGPPHRRPVLTVLRPADDPKRFASCTPCGRFSPAGAPARVTLLRELTTLSELANRDFVAELEAPSA